MIGEDEYRIAYYFTAFFSDGLDGYDGAPSFSEAVDKARKKVKEAGGAAHACIMSPNGSLLATVLNSKGRTITKKKK